MSLVLVLNLPLVGLVNLSELVSVCVLFLQNLLVLRIDPLQGSTFHTSGN